MTSDAAFLQRVADLAPGTHGPKVEAFRIVAERPARLITELTEVRDELAGLGVREGWVQSPGRVVRVAAGDLLFAAEEMPLHAELLLEDGGTFVLRQRGEGGWRVITLQREDDPAGVGLVHRHLGRGREEPLTVTEVGWELRSDAQGHATWMPGLSRFAGFEEMD